MFGRNRRNREENLYRETEMSDTRSYAPVASDRAWDDGAYYEDNGYYRDDDEAEDAVDSGRFQGSQRGNRGAAGTEEEEAAYTDGLYYDDIDGEPEVSDGNGRYGDEGASGARSRRRGSRKDTGEFYGEPESGSREEYVIHGDYVAEEPWDGAEEEDAWEEPEEKPEKHSIFRPETRKPNFILSVLVQTARIIAILVLAAGFAGLGALIGIAKGYVDTAPELDLAALDDQAQTSFIYDCNGDLITEYKGTENRVMVSLGAMPRVLRNAFIAVEDARFYSHSGVDLKRIVGAFVSNLTSSGTQGGSTITQQLIKNTLLSSEQSYKRKIQEAYLSLQLETRYTKDQILESYLNTIYLGENYYGVQVAAEGYFGKTLGELTLRECAMLAGTTNNP